MAVSPDLTAALKKVVLELEDDLRERVESQQSVLDSWREQHSAAVGRERTGMSWQEWRDDRVTMAAVAWVLTTVFVRFCEDNGLLKSVWIAGPSERRQEALDAELAYFRENPEHTDREWLMQAVEHLHSVKATGELVESHSSLWTVSPSGQSAKRLIEFWRGKSDSGDLIWDFTDPDLSTRFLGDLYQDLSDYARKTYALLQTPVFVEEFILDQTLEPALAERPLEGFKIIDPTCGSGHFLLGAFARLNERWANHAPGLETRARVKRVLEAVHGVDLNPFAVAIAKFRLMVAALQACGERSLQEAPNFHFNLATGDSLLHGSHQLPLDYHEFDVDSAMSGFAYSTEDLTALRVILTPGKYDVVVGNPPYVTVNDRILKAQYKARYKTCYGLWTLAVPFVERFFELAKESAGDSPAGWTGQINSNAFMKRGFGSRLVEEFLAKQDLRFVIDSEGAWIPGHNTDGTPTVILIGKHQAPQSSRIRAVLSKGKRETRSVGDNGEGPYWRAIVDHVMAPAYEDSFISVADLARSTFATHPWSLSGGGAPELLKVLNSQASRLRSLSLRVGFMAMSHADDAFTFTQTRALLPRLGDMALPPLVSGAGVRDFAARTSEVTWFPYLRGKKSSLNSDIPFLRALWRVRTELGSRVTTGGTYFTAGRAWWEWHQVPEDTKAHNWAIAFAEVATHNHFVLDRDGKVFNQTAPVIKLSAHATEDDHVGLLGLLNSSTSCFWLKENCKPKGGAADTAWLRTYQMNASNVERMPLPIQLPLARAAIIDTLARQLADSTPESICNKGVPTSSSLGEAKRQSSFYLERLVAEQEELDWEVYGSYGLIGEDLTYSERDLPELRRGERAFEIALAREISAGEAQPTWFTHPEQRSMPTTEIPAHWPKGYRKLVQRRLDLIESDRFIHLLEQAEHKRRWASEPWDKQVERALRGWLLDKLEDRVFWFDAKGRPAVRSVAQLADVVARNSNLVAVLELWSGRKDQSVTQQLAALLDGEGVPFLAAYRLKDSGLRKWEAWEHTWDLQRREDAGEKVSVIPVPPKYTTADFRKTAWWRHRGKLDVPKERFVLYPDAGRETDSTELLGWAGWDHAQQALSLAMVIGDREQDGWSEDRFVPLVAGLAELQPWVRQWHDEVDEVYGLNLADFCEEQLRDRALQVHQTLDQLNAWRPAPATRGRRAKV